ncbi:unnamed protein product [Calypogeia fissa]
MMKFVPGKDKGRKSKKLELLAPKKQKKTSSKEALHLSLRTSRKRKSTESGSDLSATPSPSGGAAQSAGFDFDLGSAKKLRVKRKALDRLLQAEGDDDDDDEFDEFAKNGIVRKLAFQSERERHLFIKSSVQGSMKEIRAKNRRPEWMKKYLAWVKNILSLKLQRSAPKLNGQTMKEQFADMGIIFLPNGVRAHVEDKQVPEWNVWDDSVPVHFFQFMDKFLPDNGFLAIVHSEEFEHTRKVRDAANDKSKFKHVCSFQVLLSTPMFREHVDVQVQILSLSVLCRSGNDPRLSKDSDFMPVYSGEDLRYTSLITLCLSKDRNQAFESAGLARMSVGFMQRIIKYLTKPGDVVIDWTVGEGAAFYAIDYCGCHVIGLEDRPVFDTTTEVSMAMASMPRVPERQIQAHIGDVGAGPSSSRDPQGRDLYNVLDEAWLNDQEGKDTGDKGDDASDQEE